MRPGFDPWVGKIPWRTEWQPTPVFLPGEFHGQRSLAGYSPWGCKESDTTWLHFIVYLIIFCRLNCFSKGETSLGGHAEICTTQLKKTHHKALIFLSRTDVQHSNGSNQSSKTQQGHPRKRWPLATGVTLQASGRTWWGDTACLLCRTVFNVSVMGTDTGPRTCGDNTPRNSPAPNQKLPPAL